MSGSAMPCPKCFDGHVFGKCPACDGNGYERGRPSGDMEYCHKCGGGGEVDQGDCDLCEDGSVTYSLMRLYESDKWVRANSPDWDGDNASHNGVTLYSKAEWFRRRKELTPRVRAAVGTFEPEPDAEGYWAAKGKAPPMTCVVQLLDGPPVPSHRAQILIRFWGFAWGYGGEGPNGLANVLADAGLFPTFEEAMSFVASRHADLPGIAQGVSWQVVKGEADGN